MYIKNIEKSIDNEPYNDLRIKDIFFIEEKNRINSGRLAENFLKSFPNLKTYLLKRFPLDEFIDFGNVVFRIINNIEILPKCANRNCHNKIKDLRSGHRYCSSKCSNSDKDKINKQQRTEESHGFTRKEICKRSSETKKRLNKEDPSYSTGFFGSDSFKKGMQEKYNVDNCVYIEGWKEKSFSTKIKNRPDDPYNIKLQRMTFDTKKNTIPNFIENRNKKRNDTIEQKKKEDPNYISNIVNKILTTKQNKQDADPNYKKNIAEKQRATNLAKKEKRPDEYYNIIQRRVETRKNNKNYTKKYSDSEYIYYKQLVYRYTKLSYLLFEKSINPNNYKFGRVEGTFQLDHKYSIREAFENDIDAVMIGSPVNLEIISSFENLSKGSKCSIDLSELESLYEDFIISYPGFKYVVDIYDNTHNLNKVREQLILDYSLC